MRTSTPLPFGSTVLLLVAICVSCRLEGDTSRGVQDAVRTPGLEGASERPRGNEEVEAAPGYVGEGTCATCHPRIARDYRELGMAQSFFEPRADNVIEDFENGHYFHTASGQHFEMSQRGDEFFVTRFETDSDGEQFNKYEQRITHVIGSGHHSRGYLYRTQAGEMFQMPVAWYTQEKAWGMAPGYDTPDHEGFSRPITRACMFCHNAYPSVLAGSDRYGARDVFPEHLPAGTGCERCHGPGAEHVRVASDDASTMAQLRDSIVNPSRLDPKQAMDACMQCHLQPTSRATSILRRFGVADYAYRPGMRLEDHLVHIDFDLGEGDEDRFEIDSAAYRLMKSKCFTGSDGAMSCTTCHDPHRKIPEFERIGYYSDRCFSCHEVDACGVDSMHVGDGKTAADDCVSCHMPSRRTTDVVHVVMTDHLIRRRPIEGDPLAPLEEQPAPVAKRTFFALPDVAPPGALGDLYLAIAQAKDGVPAGLDALRQAVVVADVEALEPYVELGSAELANGRLVDAIASFEKALELDPGMAIAHVNRGTALAKMQRHDDAMEAISRGLELDPESADAHFNLGLQLARRGEIERAQEHYETALRLRPVHAKCRFNLGNLLARQARFEAAIEHFTACLAIEPGFIDAYENLGLCYVRMENWKSADKWWRRGLERKPEHGGLVERLSRSMLAAPEESVRDSSRGLELAQKSLELNGPDGKRFVTLALGLVRNGRTDEALRWLEPARRHGADFSSVGHILAMAGHDMEDANGSKLYHSIVEDPAPGFPTDEVDRAILELAHEKFKETNDR